MIKARNVHIYAPTITYKSRACEKPREVTCRAISLSKSWHLLSLFGWIDLEIEQERKKLRKKCTFLNAGVFGLIENWL